MTTEERQEIISAVLSSIKTNSRLITDLTEVTTVPGESYIELSGGRRIKGTTLATILQQAIMNDAVGPTLAEEKKQREAADTIIKSLIEGLSDKYTELDGNKFDKAKVVQERGDSTDCVMSQNAVTADMNQLRQSIDRVKIEQGAITNNSISLSFTDSNGNRGVIMLGSATMLKAGLLSAQDYYKILQAFAEVRTLNLERIAALKSSATPTNVKIAIEREGDDVEDVEAEIPSATPTSAGVMSATQAKNLASVFEKNFPFEIVEEWSNQGVFEEGDEVSATIRMKIVKNGVDVYDECTIRTNLIHHHDENSGEVYFESEALAGSYVVPTIEVSMNGETLFRSYEYRFTKFVYGKSYDADKVTDPKMLLGPGCDIEELREYNSCDLELTRLSPHIGYIFAVPEITHLYVYDESGAEVDGCEQGNIDISRQCDPSIKDRYTYVIVPASPRPWRFRITNHLY